MENGLHIPSRACPRRTLVLAGLSQMVLDVVCLALSVGIASDAFYRQALIALSVASSVLGVLSIGTNNGYSRNGSICQHSPKYLICLFSLSVRKLQYRGQSGGGVRYAAFYDVVSYPNARTF